MRPDAVVGHFPRTSSAPDVDGPRAERRGRRQPLRRGPRSRAAAAGDPGCTSDWDGCCRDCGERLDVARPSRPDPRVGRCRRGKGPPGVPQSGGDGRGAPCASGPCEHADARPRADGCGGSHRRHLRSRRCQDRPARCALRRRSRTLARRAVWCGARYSRYRQVRCQRNSGRQGGGRTPPTSRGRTSPAAVHRRWFERAREPGTDRCHRGVRGCGSVSLAVHRGYVLDCRSWPAAGKAMFSSPKRR